MENKTSQIEQLALERVPESERKSWTSVAFVWMGSNICVPALMVGGMIATGMPFGQACLAMLLGFTFVCIYMSLIGSQGADLGRPSTVIFARALGSRGAGVALGLILLIACAGWFSFQTYVCGASFAGIMSQYMGINMPLWLSILIWGIIMFITSVYGFKFLKILNYISVPALIVVLVYSVIYVLTRPDGVSTLANYVPAQPMPFITGLTLAVSGFAVGAVISADFTRYCRSRRDTIISTFVGLIPVGVGTIVVGGMLAVYTGNYDITIMFSEMGIPILGLVVLILATWTTNTGNAYSAGIAAVNILKLKDNKRALCTLIIGLVGTALAIAGVINYFTAFLSFITSFLPPIAGVAIADYWIKGRGRFDNWKPWPGVNWLGIVSWAAGTSVAIGFPSLLIPTVNGIITSIVVYLILINVVKSPNVNPFTAL
jgi:cytosine permease